MHDLARLLVARRCLERVAGAGAVHQDAFVQRGARPMKTCIDIGIDVVHFAKDAADFLAKPSPFRIEIEEAT